MNTQKFLARNPERVLDLGDVMFYEDPVRGDEAPLIAVFDGTTTLRTPFMDTDDRHELRLWIDEVREDMTCE